MTDTRECPTHGTDCPGHDHWEASTFAKGMMRRLPAGGQVWVRPAGADDDDSVEQLLADAYFGDDGEDTLAVLGRAGWEPLGVIMDEVTFTADTSGLDASWDTPRRTPTSITHTWELSADTARHLYDLLYGRLDAHAKNWIDADRLEEMLPRLHRAHQGPPVSRSLATPVHHPIDPTQVIWLAHPGIRPLHRWGPFLLNDREIADLPPYRPRPAPGPVTCLTCQRPRGACDHDETNCICCWCDRAGRDG